MTDNIEPSNWCHVRINNNPADIGSRGLNALQLTSTGFYDRTFFTLLQYRPPQPIKETYLKQNHSVILHFML